MEQKDLLNQFQLEFGRLLSPMEQEIITDWKKEGFTDDEIINGLKQAVYNAALSFRYINKILQSWKTDNKNETTNLSEQDLSWLEEKF